MVTMFPYALVRVDVDASTVVFGHSTMSVELPRLFRAALRRAAVALFTLCVPPLMLNRKLSLEAHETAGVAEEGAAEVVALSPASV
jgi:hypothetical protein